MPARELIVPVAGSSPSGKSTFVFCTVAAPASQKAHDNHARRKTHFVSRFKPIAGGTSMAPKI
jgi:excinuclease UvrABC ATPase subunit